MYAYIHVGFLTGASPYELRGLRCAERYDMVIEAGGRFLTVQCKTAFRCGGEACIRFNAASAGFGPADSVISPQAVIPGRRG